MCGAAVRIPIATGWIACGIWGIPHRQEENDLMRSGNLRAVGLIFACSILICCASILVRSSARSGQEKTAATKKSGPSNDGTADAYRLNTLGAAYMNQQRPADAQKYFDQALEAAPKFAVARMNLGISLLAQQKLEPARAALEAATQQIPNDAYAWYNLGLVYKDLGETEKGIAAFLHVTEISPKEADAYYFAGYLYSQSQEYDQAIAAFQKGLALNAFHASSEFGLARALQRKGDAAAAREHLARFQKITTEHLGAPFGAGYGDQGRYSVAELPLHSVVDVPAAIPVRFVPDGNAFVSKSAGAIHTEIGPSTGACLFDFDGDGKPDLFLVSGMADGASHLLRNLGDGRFEDVTRAAGIQLTGSGLGCAAGDFDNDGHTDLAVCLSDGVRLLRNKGDGKFEDVTQSAGIRREKGCVGLTLVDYDHDGDLDLYVTTAPDVTAVGTPPHNVLWRNNGNSTFTDVSAETALGFAATGSGVVTTDFNNDRAVDFVIAGGQAGASIYLNPREGKFTPLGNIDFSKEKLPPAVGVVAFDFNKDGWMDLAFTHAGAPGISMWRNNEGKGLERVALPDFNWKSGAGVAAVDFDNDGWIDLVAVGEGANGGEVRLLRNLGAGNWADATKDAKLDAVKLNKPLAIAAADVAGTGGVDLIVTQSDGAPLLLKNHGAEKNGWMEIDLKALNDNKSAIGTKVEIYAGSLYQKWEVTGASGYLGQSALPIHVGLGSERGTDVVRLLWPTGVPQDEVRLDGRKTQAVAELDRRGSSCPVLFSWNGHKYEFIADMIGPGVVGHWVAPGERDVPDPTEYLKVSGKSLQPRDGKLSFRFLEPMEETVYLDQVKLLAIDHSARFDVYPNERFAANPPFPEFGVVPSSNAHPPMGAWDDHGKDVLSLLARRDRKYVADLEALPFTGFAKLHWVELDLGEWNPRLPLRLIIDGYTDYFTATSMYAADQAGIKVIAPYVEAQDAQGKWVRVVEDMGFPAGLERTMIADLTGKLPAGARRIRIVNNLKIYWDAIRIDQSTEAPDVRVAQVPLAKAALDFLGYPKEIRLTPASDTEYSYAERSKTGPYARAAGSYTRYGDVKQLLRAADDRFVIFSSGEGVKLDFNAKSLPSLPAGWVRDYFFFADGFEKDMDFYAAHAFTVEPLPKHGMKPYPYAPGEAYPEDAAHTGYELEYNTRQRSGKLAADLQYHFPGSK